MLYFSFINCMCDMVILIVFNKDIFFPFFDGQIHPCIYGIFVHLITGHFNFKSAFFLNFTYFI